MTTNSYLEYFLTLLGWVINNGLWNVLLSTGLFVLPLAFKVVGVWLRVREEGEDEGNKGMLSLPVSRTRCMPFPGDDCLLRTAD